jgi:hypothetical protein
MQFFFDDSGDFHQAANTDRISLCAGISFPENTLNEIGAAFESWKAQLSRPELHNGEVKGSFLLPNSRRSFFDVLSRYKSSILFHPVIPDRLDWRVARPVTIHSMG